MQDDLFRKSLWNAGALSIALGCRASLQRTRLSRRLAADYAFKPRTPGIQPGKEGVDIIRPTVYKFSLIM